MTGRFVRSSKFRHVFGTNPKIEGTYSSLKITRNPHDSNMSAVNEKFLAVVLEAQGGGSFTVLPLEKFGRVDLNAPKVVGHKSTVLDVQWDPFDDHVIASASEDCTVKVWRIPEGGLKENLDTPIHTLVKHQKKVLFVAWHPTAKDLLATAGADNVVYIWDLSRPDDDPAITLDTMFDDIIQSFSWNEDGSKFAVTTKDKRIVVVSPRERYFAGCSGHTGSKASKVVFIGEKLFTTGFSRMSERQYAVWDSNKMEKHLLLENIDSSSGVLVPFYDPGTKMVYLVGKGDTNVKYFEVEDGGESGKPNVFFLSMHTSTPSQRGGAFMPKRHLDHRHCEVARFYKLSTDKVEPIPMIVPRKSEIFQEDIYPPTYSGIPALTAKEWLDGVTKPPRMVRITKDGLVDLAPGEGVSSKSTKVAVASEGEPRTLDEYRMAYRKLLEENKKLKEKLGMK